MIFVAYSIEERQFINKCFEAIYSNGSGPTLVARSSAVRIMAAAISSSNDCVAARKSGAGDNLTLAKYAFPSGLLGF